MSEQASNVLALIVIFGFVIQQVLEFVDTFFSFEEKSEVYKKRLFYILSLAMAALIVALSVVAEKPINLLSPAADTISTLEYVITVLVLSAGTDGLNAAQKYLNYAKKKKGKESGA